MGVGAILHPDPIAREGTIQTNRQGEDFHPAGLTFLTDVSAARWVEEGLGSRFALVEALVPRGFAAYARIFHPAYTQDDRPVRWAEVAAWAGRTAHPLMAFKRISAPRQGFGIGEAPWYENPNEGRLNEGEAGSLAEFLADFTGTASRCFFAVWDGYGQFSGGGMGILSTSGGIPLSPPSEVLTSQRIKGVGRDYLLYEGRLSAISSFFSTRFWHGGPNIWWPEDRRWCVATDIDLNSTYIGGSEACIEALPNHPWLEVMPATLDAPVHIGSDTLNVP